MTGNALPSNVRVLSRLPPDHAGYRIEDEPLMAALTRAEDRHFWHRARNHLISIGLRRLGLGPPASFLELGCGAGCVAAHLARRGYRVTGVDGHLPRILQAAARAPAATFLVDDLAGGLAGLGAQRYDAVGLFDVLEHLEQPAVTLGAAAALVRPGGLLVGTVPACMALWTEADAVSGHRLRYDADGLRRLLQALAGSKVVELRGFNRLLIPPLWIQRRSGSGRRALERGLTVPWAPVNRLLELLLRLEAFVDPALDRLGMPGASLWFAVEVHP